MTPTLSKAENDAWRGDLARVREEISALVANKKDDLTANDCAGLRTLGWTLPCPLRRKHMAPIPQGYDGPLAETRWHDEPTKRLQSGAKVWEGGNRGVPLRTWAVGACFCDALALAASGRAGGLCYFEKNKKLSNPPDPGKQLKGGAEPDPTKDWIDHLAWWTYCKHFARAHWQQVVPEYDVLHLHVKRLRWALSYWLSSRCTTLQYPVAVPDYIDLEYVKDGEGDSEVALMLMRREPWVTLMPGQGIHEVRCTCNIKEGKRACIRCICKRYGSKTCSELFNCRGKFGREEDSNVVGGASTLGSSLEGEDGNGNSAMSDRSDEDTPDSESEAGEPLDGDDTEGEFRRNGSTKALPLNTNKTLPVKCSRHKGGW